MTEVTQHRAQVRSLLPIGRAHASSQFFFQSPQLSLPLLARRLLQYREASVLSGLPFAQASSSGGGPAKTASTAGKKKAAKRGLIDINTASKDQQQTLSGIGDATAQKIIEGRPCKRKNELVSKKVVPKSTCDKITDKIIAKQSK